LYANHIELGKSISEIAEENNVSYDTITRWLNINGIEANKKTHCKFNEEQISQIIKLYCEDLLSAK